MKIRLLCFAISAALLGSGCGKKENVPATVADVMSSAPSTTPTAASTGTPAATASTPAAATTAAAAKSSPAAKSGDAKSSSARVIEITASDQMKFSLATIEAKAGEELKVVLNNIGAMPKEAMGHNWVLLKAGTDANAFGVASMMAKDKDYIGDSVKDQVIAFIAILGPNNPPTLLSKLPLPAKSNICSFPGHVALMKGMLVVK